MMFYKRTREELDALEFATVDFDPIDRRVIVEWSRLVRFKDWRDMPGARLDCYVVNRADLAQEDDEIKAEDWRELCSIIGLKEGLARVFYRGVLEVGDFDNGLWEEFQSSKDLCGLCGQTGVVNTLARMWSPGGVACGVLTYCICPNGRTKKEGRADLIVWRFRND